MSEELVTVTDAAAARAKDLLARSGAVALRVRVQSAGCEGFEALLDLAHAAAPGDVELEANGVRLVADVASTLRLPGAVLDHVVTPQGAEFQWSHPDAGGPCSCAEPSLGAVTDPSSGAPGPSAH